MRKHMIVHACKLWKYSHTNSLPNPLTNPLYNYGIVVVYLTRLLASLPQLLTIEVFEHSDFEYGLRQHTQIYIHNN